MSDTPNPNPLPPKRAANAAPSDASGDTSAWTTAPETTSNPSGEESFAFLAPPQSADELGRLANYRVLNVHGRGGMGVVFLAEDLRLHRRVALKVMLPAFAKRPDFRARFLREARATAALEHDHIVAIYDVSSEDSPAPYLAMQFLQGTTLKKYLKAGHSLNIPQILRVGREVATGLAAAHACRLVHRDIKPSNIFLDATRKGRVKILDFGLARPTNLQTNLTQQGIILGTPAYMSPEQSRGESVDERCDLFSLGCVLYRCCTGRLPFPGADMVSVLMAISTAEPAPVMEVNPDIPAPLAQLVHQLLAKKPEDRPASARSVAQTIKGIERAWAARAQHTVSAPRPVADAEHAGLDETASLVNAEVEPALEESAMTNLELQPIFQIPGKRGS
jgi:serine/threonine protein kinase